MRFIKIMTILMLCLTHIFTERIYKKIMVEDTDALCLDGTLGAYYASWGVNPTKILLSFEGGGWCGSSAGVKYSI